MVVGSSAARANSLASDLEPDDVVVGAPVGSPIGRKFVHDHQTASLGLVLGRRAQHGAPPSLILHLDSYPVGIRMDGQANRAWGIGDGVGHELADQQDRQLDDRRLTPLSARASPVKTRALRTLADLPRSSTALAIASRVPRARLSYSGIPTLSVGQVGKPIGWLTDMGRPSRTRVQGDRDQTGSAFRISLPWVSSHNRRRSRSVRTSPTRRCCIIGKQRRAHSRHGPLLSRTRPRGHRRDGTTPP